MPRRPNATIGMVNCPICSELAAVRKNTAGRLYYICQCGGPVPLHGERGQEYVLTNGKLWGEGVAPPDDAPDWIKRGLGFPPGARGDRRPQTPASSSSSKPNDGGAGKPSGDAGARNAPPAAVTAPPSPKKPARMADDDDDAGYIW